jgi:hypothetical protein
MKLFFKDFCFNLILFRFTCFNDLNKEDQTKLKKKTKVQQLLIENVKMKIVDIQ